MRSRAAPSRCATNCHSSTTSDCVSVAFGGGGSRGSSPDANSQVVQAPAPGSVDGSRAEEGRVRGGRPSSYDATLSRQASDGAQEQTNGPHEVFPLMVSPRQRPHYARRRTDASPIPLDLSGRRVRISLRRAPTRGQYLSANAAAAGCRGSLGRWRGHVPSSARLSTYPAR